MADSSFPTAIDTFVDWSGQVTLASIPHSSLHNLSTGATGALLALEQKVGVNSSNVTTSLDYLLKSSSSIDPGHHHTSSSAGGGVTSFNTRTGAVTPQTGDYIAAQVTNAADLSAAAQQTFTGAIQTPALGVNTTPGATGTAKTANNILDDGSGNVTIAGYLVSTQPSPFQIATNGQIELRTNGVSSTHGQFIFSALGGLTTYNASGVQSNVLDDGSGNVTVAGTEVATGTIQTNAGFITNAITSGALPTVSLSSGVAAQVSTARDVHLFVQMFTQQMATPFGMVTVALSPNNVTFSNLYVKSITSEDVCTLFVPKSWWVKLTTAGGAVISTATYY